MDQPSPSAVPIARWFPSAWIGCVFAALAAAVGAVAELYPASGAFVAGQLALLLALSLALALLARFPLLDPVQAGVGFFYLWFGVGPLVILLHGAATGDAEATWDAVAPGARSLPFVAAGLVLFAAAGRTALLLVRATGRRARFFASGQTRLEPASLAGLALAAAAFSLALQALPFAGLEAITVINYLGGTRTEIWWAGAILAALEVGVWAAVVCLASLVTPELRTSRLVPVAGAAILVAMIAIALTSGWKSRVVFPIAILAIAWMTRRQRPPWLLVGAGALAFLTVVEPYVMTARAVAQQRLAETTEERVAVFEEVLDEAVFGAGLERYGREPGMKVDRLFRGIFPVAGEALDGTTAFDGRWHGATVARGILATVPRAILRDKPDSDVGNIFSREIGSVFAPDMAKDYDNSIALTVPVEFAANFGWVGGLGAFLLLGALWGVLSGYFLGPEPARHPFAPAFVLASMAFEMPTGAFLALLRNLVFPVLAVALVWRLRGRRL